MPRDREPSEFSSPLQSGSVRRPAMMIRRALGGVLLIALVIVGGGALYLLSSLPQLDGRIAVGGPTHSIHIARDTDGVPLIDAANDEDAAFGLGFAHAQDRLFQMELQRRYGAGRLSEIFGTQALATDRQMRVLGVYHAAEAEISYLSAPVRRALEAYAAGVNAFLAARRGALPPEFVLLALQPEPWRPADSVVWGKLIDLELAGDYPGELLRARRPPPVSPADLALLYPANPGRYLTPDGSAAFMTREEIIEVRGAAPVGLTVRATRHGPVLSDVLPEGTAESGYVLALQTSFLDPDDRTADALWNMNRARDWSGFRAALADVVGPQQNIVYADTGGTIGFIAPARIPIRKSGNGWMPVPGWTGAYDWAGYIPFDDLPQATDPPAGHFASANNKIVPERYPYFVSRDWDLPNRVERIEELLGAEPRQSLAASAAMQADTGWDRAPRLTPLVTHIQAERGPGRAAGPAPPRGR